MYTIRMYSKADMAKGHGVLSAHDEQVSLVQNYLKKDFHVVEGGCEACDINHYHTINPEFLFSVFRGRNHGSHNVGYVHFVPETLENSIRLPKPIQWLYYKYVLFFYRQMDSLVTVNPYFIDLLEEKYHIPRNKVTYIPNVVSAKRFYPMNWVEKAKAREEFRLPKDKFIVLCAVNPYFIDLLEEKYHIPRNKVTYIPNVVSAKRFYPMNWVEKAKAREEFRLPKDKFIVLCAGQLQKRKGVMDFIEIAKSMPDLHFVWAGDFSFGKISQDYEKIKEIVATPPKNVTFLGLVDHDKMNLLYNACNIMLLPSYEELFPMTVLEAMSCQIPILVRKLDIYDNILFDYVQYADTNEEFISSIRRLSEDLWFYDHCCDCSKKGSEKYSEEAVAFAWQSYYFYLMSKRA